MFSTKQYNVRLNVCFKACFVDMQEAKYVYVYAYRDVKLELKQNRTLKDPLISKAC